MLDLGKDSNTDFFSRSECAAYSLASILPVWRRVIEGPANRVPVYLGVRHRHAWAAEFS